MSTPSPQPMAPRFARTELLFAAASVAGLGAWLLSFPFGALAAWRALLASFLFFTPLAAGMAAWPVAVQVSEGRWAGSYEGLAARGLAFAPVSLLVLAVLWMGSSSWAPWSGRSFPQGAWLAPGFLFARNFAALLAFWALLWGYLRQKRAGRGQVLGPVSLVAYVCVFSLQGFDFVMALTPEWRSSLFGGYFALSGLYAGVAAWAFLACRQDTPDPDCLHDLGKLTLAFCLLTTYALYCQYLLFWYENLPPETGFAAARLHFQPWRAVSAVLLAVVYLGPVLALLTVRAKRSASILGPVCLAILAGLWLERWWLVTPSLPGGPLFGLADVGAGLGLLGLFGLSLGRLGPYVPSVPEPATEDE